MRRFIPPALLVFLGSFLLAVPTWAQEEIHLDGACAECRIVFDTIATLGDPVGPGMIESEDKMVSVDDAGRFYVMSRPATTIKVFSPDGRWEHSLGREGEGPGEFQWAQALHVSGDGRLTVVDGVLSRISKFRPDGTLEKTIPVPDITPGFEVVPLQGDSILMCGYSYSPELFGYAAHLISPDGELVRSFGDPSHEIISQDPYRLLRTLALAEGGELWLASWDRYQIERWTWDGEHLRTLVRKVDGEKSWFNPEEQFFPRAILGSIHPDEDGLIWVRLHVPAEDWTEDSPRMEAVVDVVDPAGEHLLDSSRLDGPTTPFFGDRLLGRVVVDPEEGSVQLLILRARLSRL